tara:strand:+ start:570 stop:848 length:279 start_codon:yes stop_codon:yes gene_type:complete
MPETRKDTWLESDDFDRDISKIISDLHRTLELNKPAKIKSKPIGWEGYEDLHYHLLTCDVSEPAIQIVMALIDECRKLRMAIENTELEHISF